MPAEKELTKRIQHKDIRGMAINFGVPGETLCNTAAKWQLEVLCPTKKRGK